MQLIEPEMYNTKLLDNKNIKEYVKENKAMI